MVSPDPDHPHSCSFKPKDVPAIHGKEVFKALKKINRQCSTSIDGWTKDLLNCAMRTVPGLADEIAQVLTIILSQPLSPLLLDCIRVARLVGIPKDDNGIRPIAVASIW